MGAGIANADLTLYHRVYDPALRADRWTVTQYPGVSWHGGQAATVLQDGLKTADVYTARIYTDGHVAADLEDIVCKGLLTQADPQAARKAAAESFVVTAVGDDRRGGARLRHWRLEGK